MKPRVGIDNVDKTDKSFAKLIKRKFEETQIKKNRTHI